MPQTGHCIVGRSPPGDVGQIKCKGDIVETSKLKPDLLAASARARRPTQDKRILAQLEHGVKAPARPARATGWSIDGWTIGLFALLLVMCSVAWLMHDKRITPETFRSGASSTIERSAATPASAAPAPDNGPTAEQAAAIVNMVADPASPQPAATSAGTTIQTPTAATAAIANTATAQPTRTAAAPHKPAARPVTSSASATAPAQPTGDTDVTLLTALVAHANKPATVAPERSRDVIERQDGDTTAQLLTRCKQLGLIEGMLCRSRICSGRWESDAACRAPSH
jgi:hypothetical protein